MELNRGDLVLHRSNDNIGYGLVMSKTVDGYGTKVCTVQWISSGYVHTIDVSFLEKINKDKK
tara:strand:+ start:227 stop:412 length:186 start_codon:yes stop_codon:yes gene_type:complete